MSPSIMVQNGPATTRVRSITRKPSSGAMPRFNHEMAGARRVVDSRSMSRFVRAALASISRLSGIAILAAAQAAAFDQAQITDPQTLGPKVGERVPDFSLPDQH